MYLLDININRCSILINVMLMVISLHSSACLHMETNNRGMKSILSGTITEVNSDTMLMVNSSAVLFGKSAEYIGELKLGFELGTRAGKVPCYIACRNSQCSDECMKARHSTPFMEYGCTSISSIWFKVKLSEMCGFQGFNFYIGTRSGSDISPLSVWVPFYRTSVLGVSLLVGGQPESSWGDVILTDQTTYAVNVYKHRNRTPFRGSVALNEKPCTQVSTSTDRRINGCVYKQTITYNCPAPLGGETATFTVGKDAMTWVAAIKKATEKVGTDVTTEDAFQVLDESVAETPTPVPTQAPPVHEVTEKDNTKNEETQMSEGTHDASVQQVEEDSTQGAENTKNSHVDEEEKVVPSPTSSQTSPVHGVVAPPETSKTKNGQNGIVNDESSNKSEDDVGKGKIFRPRRSVPETPPQDLPSDATNNETSSDNTESAANDETSSDKSESDKSKEKSNAAAIGGGVATGIAGVGAIGAGATYLLRSTPSGAEGEVIDEFDATNDAQEFDDREVSISTDAFS